MDQFGPIIDIRQNAEIGWYSMDWLMVLSTAIVLGGITPRTSSIFTHFLQMFLRSVLLYNIEGDVSSNELQAAMYRANMSFIGYTKSNGEHSLEVGHLYKVWYPSYISCLHPPTRRQRPNTTVRIEGWLVLLSLGNKMLTRNPLVELWDQTSSHVFEQCYSRTAACRNCNDFS